MVTSLGTPLVPHSRVIKPLRWLNKSRHLLMPDDNFRMCPLPDAIILDATLCKLPNRFTWTVERTFQPFSEQDLTDLYGATWRKWAESCGIEPVYTPNARTANVIHSARRIDTNGRILGECQLPCGIIQVWMWMDTADTWIDSDNPGQGEIDVRRVILHESGHALGYGHHAEGIIGLMSPMYSRSIRFPQPVDILPMVQRYGGPAVIPFPPVPPVPIPPAPVPPVPIPPGGNMDRASLRRRLEVYIGIARGIAGITPTALDDQIVRFLTEVFAQDWAIDLLLLLLARFGSGSGAGDARLTLEALSMAMTEFQRMGHNL